MPRKFPNSASERLLMVSHLGDDFRGGAEIGFRDAMTGLHRKRPDLDIFAVYPQAGAMAEDANRRGIGTVIGRIPWWAYLDGQLPFLKFAKRSIALCAAVLQSVYVLVRLRPTIVLTNTMVIPSYAIGAKLLGIPHIWMVREFGRKEIDGFRFILGHRRTVRGVGRLSELVVCNSRAVESALLAVDPTINTTVIYPVIDSTPGAPTRREPSDPLRAIMVGKLARSKGQHLAIEAIATARRDGVDIELVLVGGGEQEPLIRLADDLGVTDLVDFCGPSDDVARYWRTAHVGLMCSQSEAFGRVTAEAMSAGLPVCGTEAGGTTEIIDPGVNGLLSPPGDVEALAGNLMALARDESLRYRLALNARHSARRFERERFDDELAAVVGSVLRLPERDNEAGPPHP